MANFAFPDASFVETLAFMLNLGWSLIPLLGANSSGREKAPALPSWAEYQHRRATGDEIQRWFLTGRDACAGVVLGRISGLAVIDIDSLPIAEKFQSALPDLAQTFTVQSGNRGLPHYYYRIDRLAGTVASRRLRGLEFRAEGQYVVAPGTRIGDRHWRVTNPVQPRQLTPADLERIDAFMASLRPSGSAASPQPADYIPTVQKALSPARLIRRYRQQVERGEGRNNALFHCACLARDQGWTSSRTEAALVGVHRAQITVADHPHETERQRDREARATIRSAYKRPARPLTHTPLVVHVGLPNSVRERLLQRGKVNVARVLDALLLDGLQADETLKAADVVARVGVYGIGRNAVYTALRYLADEENLSPRAPLSNADSARSPNPKTKQCLFGRVANPVKNRRGRPERLLTMPTTAALCEWLGVENRGGDALTAADLRSPAAYRAALHRLLIDRSPGVYPRQWQAQRLACSADSCRRYERQQGISVTPQFHETPISWANLDKNLADEPIIGRFLMDGQRKRYPALKDIAKHLLKRGERVALMTQQANFYGNLPTISCAAETSKAAESVPERWAWVADLTPESAALSPSAPSKILSDEPLWNAPAPDLSAPDGALYGVEDAPIHAAQTALYQMAGKVYDLIRALNPARSVTHKTAYAWVKTFGISAVEQGLAVLNRRQNIHNPAGFLLAYLRAETGLSAPPASPKKADPQADYRRWIDAMKASKYAHLLVNAEDLFAVEF